jgi:hypothetical protein
MTKVRIALMRGNADVEPMVIWYTNEIYAERKYLSNNKARENRVKRRRKKKESGEFVGMSRPFQVGTRDDEGKPPRARGIAGPRGGPNGKSSCRRCPPVGIGVFDLRIFFLDVI